VALVVFPGLRMLDVIGPWEALLPSAELHLLGSTTDEFLSDTGVPFRATELLADAAPDYDAVFVPGGEGTAAAMCDPQIIDFLADRGERARYVTSVCTGAFVLAAAGLLQGYKATTHWATLEALSLFGAVPTEGRVVIDRNRITGGGVTAGIDFGLTLLAEMFDDEAARLSQLVMEYDPAPPFAGGSPRTSSAGNIGIVRAYIAPLIERYEQLAAENVHARSGAGAHSRSTR
jgi:transcriptional regulator GlxA family with amidase domain